MSSRTRFFLIGQPGRRRELGTGDGAWVREFVTLKTKSQDAMHWLRTVYICIHTYTYIYIFTCHYISISGCLKNTGLFYNNSTMTLL